MTCLISCNRINSRGTAETAVNSDNTPETSHESFKLLQDNGNQPWGVWNEWKVTKEFTKTLYEGEYYIDVFGDGSHSITITQDQYFKFPIFTYPGAYEKILKYERNEEGLLFYMLGQGVRDNSSGPPSFKDDFEYKIQMTFLSENECQFVYIVDDEEGYRVNGCIKQNFTYYRFPRWT
ncbi:MAG: hypothetical protein LBC76_01395 [Treponema sp.]|nr:hypothetical protein [Treponema sp.]